MMKQKGQQGAIGQKPDILKIAGFTVSVIALAATIFNFILHQKYQRELDEVKISQVLGEVFDLLGGEKGATWVGGIPKEGYRQKLEEARRKLEDEVLKLRPDNRRGLELHGIYFVRIGRKEKAVEVLRELTNLYSEYHKGWANYGAALIEFGDLSAAEKALRKAIELEPKYPQAHDSLGRLLQIRGEASTAEQCFRGAIAADEWYAPAHNNLGVLLDSMGRDKEAEQCYRKAISCRFNFIEPHVNLGRNLSSRKLHDQAKKEMECAKGLGFTAPNSK